MATTAAALYRRLENARLPFLERARDCAKLTIPALMPPQGHTGQNKLPTPYQGLGARGVNNLASKLLLTLLPPNAPFFRYVMDDFTVEQMTRRVDLKGKVEKALGKYERAIMSDIEASALRVPLFEALKQLVNSGNILLYLPPKDRMRAFKLDRYVVKRDPMGNVLDIVALETVAPDTLPEGFVEKLDAEQAHKFANARSRDKNLELFTHISLRGGRWVIYQECMGLKIPGTEGSYPKDKSPWLALRFTAIDGEDYGRGYVEEYYGDLKSLETLSKAVVEGSAAAAKVLLLVNPNGVTSLKTVAEAPNGSVRAGKADDVTVLQMDKYADFRVAKEMIEEITQRLAFAFLLNSAIQRNGERVTAEEIRYMAGELEDALGGIYSILSLELQLPVVTLTAHRLALKGTLPTLPKNVKPTITTGLEALGRGHDLNRLDAFMERVQRMGPEAQRRVVWGELLDRTGASLGVSTDGLIKDEEQVQQEIEA
ncbi:MAG: hypothetical protein J0I48_10545, partial [Devosia sp.]|nr:hypothetical protein [Devosia sp.]